MIPITLEFIADERKSFPLSFQKFNFCSCRYGSTQLKKSI